jgi:RHS repeat-associated protein
LTGVAGTFTTAYAYNIKGDLTQMTYPSGRVLSLNYQTGGGCCNSRLASVVDQTTNTTIGASMAYNAAGETTTRTLGNGVVETFGYNNRLQQTTITAALGATTMMNFSYNYGVSGNTGRVLARTDAIQAEHSVNYTYDSLYRLSRAAAAGNEWGISWTFDAWGNRLTQTPLGLATSKVGKQTLGYTNNRNNSYSYDAVGNQTNDGLHNYTFNAENQITQMDGGAAVYAYDGEGRRMKKTVGSETTYYFYGVGGLLCEFTTANTGATQAASTDRATYRTSDKLGSAVLIIDASGTVIENNRTLPYGEAWLPEVASTNEKKFTSYERDVESNLDYAMNRYYAHVLGRFISVDIGESFLKTPQSLNRYTYSLNDPINFVDAKGENPECPPGLQNTCVDVTTPPPPPVPTIPAGYDSAYKVWTQAVSGFSVPVQRAVSPVDYKGLQDCFKQVNEQAIERIQLALNAEITDIAVRTGIEIGVAVVTAGVTSFYRHIAGIGVDLARSVASELAIGNVQEVIKILARNLGVNVVSVTLGNELGNISSARYSGTLAHISRTHQQELDKCLEDHGATRNPEGR